MNDDLEILQLIDNYIERSQNRRAGKLREKALLEAANFVEGCCTHGKVNANAIRAFAAQPVQNLDSRTDYAKEALRIAERIENSGGLYYLVRDGRSYTNSLGRDILEEELKKLKTA